jgi:hypothetical protein
MIVGPRALSDRFVAQYKFADLRVITLADKVTILNAFPDWGFKP